METLGWCKMYTEKKVDEAVISVYTLRAENKNNNKKRSQD
jgi:hypothetical protein